METQPKNTDLPVTRFYIELIGHNAPFDENGKIPPVKLPALDVKNPPQSTTDQVLPEFI